MAQKNNKDTRPAELVPGGTDNPAFLSNDGKTVVVSAPTWMILPPELGGKKANIEDVFMARRCKCGTHENAKIFVFAKYICVECTKPGVGFMWIKKPDDMKKFKQTMTGEK